ncbi:MAG: type II toxin-antitoxin system VapC family toxin [Chloroflexota bacterium]|nr:type II toxin-antitoxin system VapC family toxin [Chloroflexota bacterium]
MSATASRIITDLGNEVLLSVASLWEMAIKVRKGTLIITSGEQPFAQAILQDLRAAQIGLLDITPNHALAVSALPLGNHKDPFDRLIAMQAVMEGIPLLSRDTQFDQYGVQRIW